MEKHNFDAEERWCSCRIRLRLKEDIHLTFMCLINFFLQCVNNLKFVDSVVTVINTDIATAVDSFHRITTATVVATTTTVVATDAFDGRCSVGAPQTVSTAAAASDMVNSERLYDVMPSLAATGPASRPSDWQGRSTIARFQLSDN